MSSMNKLFCRLQLESEGRTRINMKADIASSISESINQYIAPLKAEIKKERSERKEQFSSIEKHMQEIDQRVAQLEEKKVQISSDQSRQDEIVIGGFQLKSKDGAITMVKEILKDIAGNPTIVDRVANVPSVIPIKFDSVEAANKFVQEHKFKKDFAGYFEGFWCNISQSKEDRIAYNRDVAPLFKMKRAILETIDGIEASQVVVDKAKKKVFIVEGFSLQLVGTMISKSNVQWNDHVTQVVKDRYRELTV